jgi:hypothetical protein
MQPTATTAAARIPTTIQPVWVDHKVLPDAPYQATKLIAIPRATHQATRTMSVRSQGELPR